MLVGKNKSSKKHSTTRIEIIIVLLVSILLYIIFGSIDALESIALFLQKYDEYEFDEIIAVAVVLLIYLVIRFRILAHQLKTEIRTKKEKEFELKTSLQENQTLLRELHHRVKNNLQMILSLITLQESFPKGSSPAELFGDIKNKVYSIALSHELLYQNEELSSVKMSKYLRTLVENILNGHPDTQNINVYYDIDAVELDIAFAIPCGLITNEIITNILKHAFDDSHEIKNISIFMSCKEKRVSFSIQDNGKGYPENALQKQTPGMGLQLIDMLTTKQLNGCFHIHNRNGGIVELSFPLVAVNQLIS